MGLCCCRDFLKRNFEGILQLTIHGARDLKAVNVRTAGHRASMERHMTETLPATYGGCTSLAAAR
jgi:hypothetical protein